jgi:tRNA 2-thiouridine synthesizing protein D
MNFTLAVHGAPYASTASQSALGFAAAAVRAGHTVNRVFFFHEGVMTAQRSVVPPQDEEDLAAQWQTLATDHDVELAVCIANALKRGLLDATERDRYEKDAATLAEGFTLVGLGQLIDAIASSDRYVEFPA